MVNKNLLSKRGLEELGFFNECQSIFNNHPHPDFLLESTYSYKSIIMDMLTTIHTNLNDYFEKLSERYNNYNIQYVAFVKMYENHLVKLEGDMIFNTYEYPNYNDLPKKVNMEKSLDVITKLDITKESITKEVDTLIKEFAIDLLGNPAKKIDIYGYKISFQNLCYDLMLGKPRSIKITRKNIREVLLEEIYYLGSKENKEVREHFKSMKGEMNESYRLIKKMIDNSIYLKKSSDIDEKDVLQYFDITWEMNDQELVTANKNILEIHRMYTTMITMFNIAYNTKMQVMDTRLNASRDFLNDIISTRQISEIYGKKIVDDMRNIEDKK